MTDNPTPTERARKLQDAATDAVLDALVKPHVPAPAPEGGNPFDDLRSFGALLAKRDSREGPV